MWDLGWVRMFKMTHSFIWYLLRDSCKAELRRDAGWLALIFPMWSEGLSFSTWGIVRLLTSQLRFPRNMKAEATSKDLGPKHMASLPPHTIGLIESWVSLASAWKGVAHRCEYWKAGFTESHLWMPVNTLYWAHSFKKAFPVLVTHGKWGPPIAAIASVGHFQKPNELWCQSPTVSLLLRITGLKRRNSFISRLQPQFDS